MADVVRTVSAREGVSNVVSPLDHDGASLVSRDGRAALVQLEIADEGEHATTLVGPVLDAVAAIDERSAEFRVEQFGSASAMRALDETIGEDFARAEYTALPVTLGILVVVFGALVAAGLMVPSACQPCSRRSGCSRWGASSSRWTKPRTP